MFVVKTFEWRDNHFYQTSQTRFYIIKNKFQKYLFRFFQYDFFFLFVYCRSVQQIIVLYNTKIARHLELFKPPATIWKPINVVSKARQNFMHYSQTGLVYFKLCTKSFLLSFFSLWGDGKSLKSHNGRATFLFKIDILLLSQVAKLTREFQLSPNYLGNHVRAMKSSHLSLTSCSSCLFSFQLVFKIFNNSFSGKLCRLIKCLICNYF